MSDIRWWYRSKLMSRGQPTSRDGGATPASSQIIFLEQRIAELEAALHDLHTLVIPELQLDLKDAQEKVAAYSEGA